MQKIALEHSKVLSKAEILSKIQNSLSEINITDKRVLIICEDVTRATPLNQFFPDFLHFLQAKASSITILFALGTHRSMTFDEMIHKLGISSEKASQIKLINHNAFDDSHLIEVGIIDSVPVKINRAIADSDIIITLGSVLPHRVVGFSGGAKYLCPGIANQAIIDYTHWKITCFSEAEIIGKIENPIRQILHQIAELVLTKFPKVYLSINCITLPSGIHDIFIGDFYNSYRQAAELSGTFFIKPVEPCSSLLAYLDDKSVDFWQGAKAIYNCASVIKDGGKIVIRGQLSEKFSPTHGKIIEKFGYSNPETIQNLVDSGEITSPVVASHLMRVSQALSRIHIFLSSENIDPELCHSVNLGYIDPQNLKASDFDYIVYNSADLILTQV